MSHLTPGPRVEVTAATPGDQQQPFVAALPGGGQVVVWTSGTAAGRTVMYEVFDAAGNSLGGERPLFEQQADWAVAGGVAVLADGSIVVSGGGAVDGSAALPSYVVLAQRLDAAGQPLGAPSLVHAEQVGHPADRIAAGEVHAAPDGGYYVEIDYFFRPTPRPGWATTLQRMEADGGKTGAAFLAADGGPHGAIAVLAGGHIVSAHDQFLPVATAVEWSVFAAGGARLAHTALPVTPPAQDSAPSVAALAGGDFIVVWHHAGAPSAGWRGQLADAGGQALGPAFAMSLPDQAEAVELLGLASGGFLAFWRETREGEWHFMAQAFDALARPLEHAFAIAPPEPATQDNMTLPRVSATADGGFVVAFDLQSTTSGYDVFTQEFAPAGGAAGQLLSGGKGKDVLTGAQGDDVLLGGHGKDRLEGGAGNDFIDGGLGKDTAIYAGVRADYTITASGPGFVVTDLTGAEGVDQLLNVERLAFSDQEVVLVGHPGAPLL